MPRNDAMNKMFTPSRLALAIALCLASMPLRAQISMSGGNYTQDFDSLGSANASWTDNATLVGWYASKGVNPATNYFAGSGAGTTGGIYSFGTSGVNPASDRALGSVASGSASSLAYGVRFVNDTGQAQTNILVSYTGEQWRSGTNTPQSLTFSCQVSSSPLTNPAAAGWTSVSALDFSAPNLSVFTTVLDGNDPANRTAFSNVLLAGVAVAPGEELFLRWLDIDNTGSDSGLAIDDLTVQFASTSPFAPVISTQPIGMVVTQGATAAFSVVASGNPAPTFQWQFNSANLPGETNATLTLTSVATNQAGNYRVAVSNAIGFTNSDTVVLTVVPASPLLQNFSLLTYNVKGNGAVDWSTNAAQVQAIARQLQYLLPDAVTFNEIPFDLRYEMTNFVKAFLPGYQIAISSGTDGYIVSAIASRYPIVRSQKWLAGVDLKPFGYTNTSTSSADNFTRDLFEAEIAVPDTARHWHVFTTHLKSTSGTTYADAAAKRAAEAAAITNFFATNLFVLYPLDPYTLSGDFNDSDTNALAIQRLVSPPTGLRLANPKNPYTGSINTYSALMANPSERIDYILSCALLYSNINASQVFRSDRLTPNLFSDDSQVASDHYPVLMEFKNPYKRPVKITSFEQSGSTSALGWKTVPGEVYGVETSTNLVTWSGLKTNLTATNYNLTLVTNISGNPRFFRVRIQ